MAKKLIFLDIDGTLNLPGRSLPPPSAQEAVRQARSLGHRVFLATGRNWMMTRGLMALGFDGAVCCAGGQIRCGDQVIYDRPMSPQLLERTVSALEENGISYILEAQDAVFCAPGTTELMLAGTPADSEIARWQAVPKAASAWKSLAEYDGCPIYKLVFFSPDDASIRRASTALEEDFFVCIQNAFGGPEMRHGELIHRAFDKGAAMGRVCRHLGVDMADTVAFGDSMNDLAMLQTAGTGVCMADGDPALKAVCDLVCPPAAQDGLAQAFARLGLI